MRKIFGELLLLFICFEIPVYATDPVKMVVHNHAGFPIELFWINTFRSSRDLVLQTERPIRNSSATSINSYATHEFLIKFHNEKAMTHPPTGKFIKKDREETVNIYFDKKDNNFIIQQTTPQDVWTNKIRSYLSSCNNNNTRILDGDDDHVSSCVAEKVVVDLNTISEEKSVLEEYHNKVAHAYRNYTCADTSLRTSPAIDAFTYKFNGTSYSVNTLLDMPRAKIWMTEDFITDAECDQFRKESKGKLQRATVAATDGTSVISNHRKANQAHYSFPSDPNEREKDVLWPLYKRAMDFANKYGKHDIHPDGQEDYTIIQYNPDDEYMPHCDGQCDGEAHKAGGRIFTAVLYCEVPKVGGGTSFSKADVFVQPKKNAVAFFSYKGEDGMMDSGYTEHSGCPVIEGEKWISVIWFREGVSRERAWDKIDPEGIEILTGGETDETESEEL